MSTGAVDRHHDAARSSQASIRQQREKTGTLNLLPWCRITICAASLSFMRICLNATGIPLNARKEKVPD